MSVSDNQTDDFPLPTLNPLIKLFSASPDRDGLPRWSLYHPAANKYYYIGWTEFECLARFHKFENASDVINDINKTTTLNIDIDDIKALILFLQTHGLLNMNSQNLQSPAKQKPLWERIVHGYLFFTIPLFKPQKFLEKTLPVIRPFLSKTFFIAVMVILAIGIILTIQRFDEFTHTFLEMFSVKGAMLTAVTFTIIKIIHEFSHAYTATKYGVRIPHMGAAFIVMYPILYTETSGAWRLQSKRHRIYIGLAGVAAELALATIALILWHILPPGTQRSIAFSVVAISLIGSLLINLNPLMRFDGYFVLSDALNIENLHARAIAMARWRLRKTLFNLKDPAPDTFTNNLQKFMQIFGFAIIIYRFFLFSGIAFLVYTLFLKPLGLILLILELTWFIGLPILSELKIWWQRRDDILHRKRSIITIAIILIITITALSPTQNKITIDGVLHAKNQRIFFAPSPAMIKTLNVTENQTVKSGDILAVLVSDRLEEELETLQTERLNLQTQLRREKLDTQRYKQYGANLEDQLKEKQQAINAVNDKKERLVIKAPFDATLRDIPPEIQENRYVSTQDALFTLVNDDEVQVTGYVRENDLSRIHIGNSAKFRPDFSLFEKQDFKITNIDALSAKTISRLELSSIYHGNIPSNYNQSDEIQALEPIYLVTFERQNARAENKNYNTAMTGKMRVEADNKSALLSFINRFIALIIREAGFN